MTSDLGDLSVVITGAASGIGRAIAEACAEASGGAVRLLLTDLDADGLARVAGALPLGTRAETLAADLSDPAAAAAIAAEARAAFGRIDGLVNAAGVTDRASLVNGTAADFDRVFAINARAPFLLMQAAIADMRRRGAPGSIVNIQSMNAHCGSPDLAIYAASKGALQTLTRNAAHAHMAAGIRVNGINLGWVLTPAEDRMQSEVLGKGPDWAEEAGAALPLGRLLQPDEAARLALYLLGPGSAPLSGASIDLEQWLAGAPP